jgi:N-acetylglucosamine malate deacetylase 1
MMDKLDILAIAAHPDDAEISCSGTLLKAVADGKKVGILDLTKGELGSRGSAEIRMSESAASSKVLQLSARENLALKDGFFSYEEESIKLIIQQIRRFQPDIVLCNAPSDRHPDHGRASKLTKDACFYSGLLKIETEWEGSQQLHWRPGVIYSYIQDYYLEPDFVVDITEFWDKKMEALQCFSSQFFDPKSSEPKTPISGEEFFEFLRARAMQYGRPSGFMLAEGFIAERPIGLKSLHHIL